jgi:hypothetical protein
MFASLKKDTKKPCVQFAISILIFFSLFSSVNAGAEPNKTYLRLEQSKLSDKNDLKISSIGALAFKGNTEGHIDLSYLESDIHGNEWALDLGGGYVLGGDVSLFLGLGITLGYNEVKDDFIGAYYPEVGIVLDVSKTFGITIRAKRFYNRYEKNEEVVMVGLVFRE